MGFDQKDMPENVFHDHIDVCERCRNQPFNLCSVGAAKLHEAAAVAQAEVLKHGAVLWPGLIMCEPKKQEK